MAGSPVRVALWCVPRTVSTAVMRSFAQRADTRCVDEPLYAWYLEHSGRRHPMHAEVLAAQPRDWRTVVDEVLFGPCPAPVHFAKHMCHHLAGIDDLSWVRRCRNVFLIRDPREMLASFVKDLDAVEEADTGYAAQAGLFRSLAGAGAPPLVVDSRDLLTAPEAMLRKLCGALGLPFDPAMLAWPPGRHPSYGVWAPHWYANVEKSTGFAPWQPKTAPFPAEMESLLARAQPHYELLHAARLQA